MRDREMGDRVERLRALRGRRWSARPIGGEVARVAAFLERSAARRDAKLEAWESVVPAALRRGCVIESGSGGGAKGAGLVVRAGSAAGRFALDRWLKSGGAEKLRAKGVGKVRVV